MSDGAPADVQTEDAQAAEDEKFERGPIIQPDVDDMLSHFIKLANMGIPQDVTLFVAGSIVTGTLVSGRMYFQNLARLVGPSEEEAATALRDFYLAKADRYVDPKNIPDNHTEGEPAYVHLHNAHWLVGTQFTTQNGLFWRGRISRVDGFVLGRAANG